MPIDPDDTFRSLPMADLTGGPLGAAQDARRRAAAVSAAFIDQIAHLPSQAAVTPSDANGLADSIGLDAKQAKGRRIAPTALPRNRSRRGA